MSDCVKGCVVVGLCDDIVRGIRYVGKISLVCIYADLDPRIQ